MSTTRTIQALLTVALFGLLGAVTTSSLAEQTSQPNVRMEHSPSAYPSYYPLGFQRKGMIGNEGDSKSFIIDGIRYNYRASTLVHTPKKEKGSLLDMRPGQAIGFSYTQDQDGRRTLTEVWLIDAKDYTPN